MVIPAGDIFASRDKQKEFIRYVTFNRWNLVSDGVMKFMVFSYLRSGHAATKEKYVYLAFTKTRLFLFEPLVLFMTH